ncbi:unnamed protein product [Lasius platythorax]|uniref:Uncharacterized protein n=1 Tax=Lasius platythorax TaxID=488582 RepID=A0AAV2P6R4_9HYME
MRDPTFALAGGRGCGGEQRSMEQRRLTVMGGVPLAHGPPCVTHTDAHARVRERVGFAGRFHDGTAYRTMMPNGTR